VTLTFYLFTLNFYSTSDVMCLNSYKFWVKLNNPRLSYWQFSTFSSCNFRSGAFSGVHRHNLTKYGEDSGRSLLHCTFVSELEYLVAFLNAGGSKLSDVENDAKFCTLWPPPVKITGRVRKIYASINKALPTTEPPEYIW